MQKLNKLYVTIGAYEVAIMGLVKKEEKIFIGGDQNKPLWILADDGNGTDGLCISVVDNDTTWFELIVPYDHEHCDNIWHNLFRIVYQHLDLASSTNVKMVYDEHLEYLLSLILESALEYDEAEVISLIQALDDRVRKDDGLNVRELVSILESFPQHLPAFLSNNEELVPISYAGYSLDSKEAKLYTSKESTIEIHELINSLEHTPYNYNVWVPTGKNEDATTKTLQQVSMSDDMMKVILHY